MNTIAQLEALGLRKGWIKPRSQCHFLKYYTPKTERRAGLVVAYIRHLLKRRKTISASALCPPLAMANAYAILSKMKDLKRIKNGRKGAKHHPAIYAKTTNQIEQ